MLTTTFHNYQPSPTGFPQTSVRHAVAAAIRAGVPDRWTHFVGWDRYGFLSRQFARLDAIVMRDVASIRRREVTQGLIRHGMRIRATMADETAPRQFCDRGTK